MTVREAILQRISAYLAATAMSEHTFGKRVCGDHKLVSRLRQSSVTLERIEKAEAFMRDNPPAPTHAKPTDRRAASPERASA